MNLHVSVCKDYLADAASVVVKLFVGTTQDDRVEELSHHFVPFLEAATTTLGAPIFHSLSTSATEGLVALQTVLWVRHQVETDKASESLFEKLLLASIPTLCLLLLSNLQATKVLGTIPRLEPSAYQRLICQVHGPLDNATRVYCHHRLGVVKS